MAFTKNLTTNAQATIADGYWPGYAPGAPPDGTPDKIAPGGNNAPLPCFKLVPPFLVAGKGSIEVRGVAEFGIGTLAGASITAATLFVGVSGPGGQWADESKRPLVFGYHGDGSVSLADFSRQDVPLGPPGATQFVDRTTVPATQIPATYPPAVFVTTNPAPPGSQPGDANVNAAGTFLTISHPTFPAAPLDVTAFLQAAITAGQTSVGFVFRGDIQRGSNFPEGCWLRVTSEADFTVPAPLAAPAYT